MENSTCSSPNKAMSISEPSMEADSLAEESGWTQYIEDFEAYNEENQQGYVQEKSSYYSDCSSFMSASMVSDAGSGPEWKNKNTVINHGVCSSSGVLPKRLNFKKKIPFDDSLEDTASSPVNSPKITTFFKRMDINSRKMENDNGSPMSNEISIEEHVEYNDINNRGHDLKDDYGNDVDTMELKQKGLCLVPVSMVMNYLG